MVVFEAMRFLYEVSIGERQLTEFWFWILQYPLVKKYAYKYYFIHTEKIQHAMLKMRRRKI